jgi:FAD synthase
MVTSIGTNPFYNGEKKTIVCFTKNRFDLILIIIQETHIMHEFSNDLYGEKLKIVLLGEIRQMIKFKNKSKISV